MTTRIETIPFPGEVGVNSKNSVAFGRYVTSRAIGGVDWEVCAFWGKASAENSQEFFYDMRLILGKRVLPWGDWTWYVCNGLGGRPNIPYSTGFAPGGGLNDYHNSVAIGIDSAGFLHVAYDNRNSPLKYRKSTTPLATWNGSLTAVLAMTGSNENSVSYPDFVTAPNGDVFFTFRNGVTLAGNVYMYRYDVALASWSGVAGAGTGGLLLDGSGEVGAYPFGSVCFSHDWDGLGVGFAHLAWTWRIASDLNNEHIAHMRWDGTSWTQYDGTAQTMPATRANNRAVWSVPTSEGLMNTTGICLDGNSRPHIAVQKISGGYYQLHDLYFNGSVWALEQITSYASGTDWNDWGRPWAECDTSTNEVFFWYTHAQHEPGVMQWASAPNNFTSWTKTTFLNDHIGAGEPIVDRARWQQDNVVRMWIFDGRLSSSGRHSPRIITRLPKGRSTPYNEDWGRAHPIDVQSAQVGGGGVTGYTVLLTRDNFSDETCDPVSANKAQEDGGDLRFFADAGLTSEVACAVISFGYDSVSAAGDAAVQIRVGPLTLSSTENTTIYVAYSASVKKYQPFVDEPMGSIAAHDANWALAAPMDKAEGNVVNITDAHYAGYGGQVNRVTGKVGGGVGVNGAVSVTAQRRVYGIGSAFSVAAWVNAGSSSQAQQIVCADADTNRGLHFRLDDNGQLRLIRFNSSNGVIANYAGGANLKGAGWKRVVGEFNTAVGSQILIDGVQAASDGNLTANNDSAALTWSVGSRARTASPFVDGLFNGAIDQVEIHTTRRGDAWWATDFNNTNSPETFAIAGTAFSLGAIIPTLSGASFAGRIPSVSLSY